MDERLQKILAQWGVASRRGAEQMILEGRVRLNGDVAQLGQKADPERDWIEVDDQLLQPESRPKLIYLLLHKPAGVVTTCNDPQNRDTVLDLLPSQLRKEYMVHPVGRLDADSTGALLLTNDGNVTFCLTHPRHLVPKTYRVWVQGCLPKSALEAWRQGVMLSDRRTLPAEVSVLESTKDTQTLLEIVLREGRNRQIRRVAAQLGFPVLQLHRVAIGSIRLQQLLSGQYRPLLDTEIFFLQTQASQFQQEFPNPIVVGR